MNAKAAELGMARTKFADPTGLSAENVSTATDLAKLVEAAANYPLIREWSTASSHFVVVEPTGRVLGFNNTNALVRNAQWDIQLSKTGYIREAGRCLAMMVNIASKPFVIVLLDSVGRRTRLGDAARVKSWLEAALVPKATAAGRPVPVRAAPDKAKPKERVTGNFQPQRASNADGSVASIQPGGSR
jgi:D-alanyl-D-alanine endopeptidase (penicillin-binding protein 7)